MIGNYDDFFLEISYNSLSNSINQLNKSFILDKLIVTIELSALIIKYFPRTNFEEKFPQSWLKWMLEANKYKECEPFMEELVQCLNDAAQDRYKDAGYHNKSTLLRENMKV